LPALVALPAEAMLRKPLFGLEKRRYTAGTLSEKEMWRKAAKK
jgi:hypothetical protein